MRVGDVKLTEVDRSSDDLKGCEGMVLQSVPCCNQCLPTQMRISAAQVVQQKSLAENIANSIVLESD